MVFGGSRANLCKHLPYHRVLNAVNERLKAGWGDKDFTIASAFASEDNTLNNPTPLGPLPGKDLAMVMKLATVAMVMCSLVILGIVFAQSKRTPVLTTDDVALSGDRSRVRPGDDGRLPGTGGSQYTGPVPREIAWEHDVQGALRSAADGNRVVVVDVYTDWCGWCKRMDKDIYSDPQVAALGREAVFLKLNAEDQREGQRFAREHGVRGYPTTIIMDSRGRALQKEAGYMSPPAAFVQWVRQARNP